MNAVEQLQTFLKNNAESADVGLRSGVRVRFTGTNLQKPLEKVWAVEDAPDKKEMLDSIKKLFEQMPESERDQWTEKYQEAQAWINQVPPEGLDAPDRFVICWPPSRENDNDGENSVEAQTELNKSDADGEQEEPTICLEIVGATALTGEPPSTSKFPDNEKPDSKRIPDDRNSKDK